MVYIKCKSWMDHNLARWLVLRAISRRKVTNPKATVVSLELKLSIDGAIVQLVRILRCHRRGRGFNPRWHRQSSL